MNLFSLVSCCFAEAATTSPQPLLLQPSPAPFLVPGARASEKKFVYVLLAPPEG